MDLPKPSIIGKSIRRLEDPRMIRGQARYLDDVQLPHLCHAAILRSPHAHANLVTIDLDDARRVTGVVDVFSFEQFADLIKPIPVRLNPYGSLKPFLQYPLARDRVRYVGEPVAGVVAESRYLAEDALEQIHVDYDPLTPSVDARADPPATIHEAASDNVASSFVVEHGDVDRAFAEAERIVRTPFTVGRHTGIPLETRGLVAYHDKTRGRLRVWGPTKVTHFNRGVLAQMLEMPEHRIQFIEPDVGGSFGVRGEFYPEDFLIPSIAMKLTRPVKWVEDRMEHLMACNHSRQQFYDLELALKEDGSILGAKVRLTNDMGGYIRTHGIIVPELSAGMFPGTYHFPSYRCEVRCVLTNKTPTGTYRSPGRFEANSARERLLDLAAGELGMEPAVLRFKNMIPRDAMPYAVGTRSLGEDIVYDSGDYPHALQEVLQESDYQARHEQRHAESASSLKYGLGMGCFVEKTGLGPFEGAKVEIDSKGRVIVSTGAASVGQGLETVLAQIAAEVLGVAPETVCVLHGDTDLIACGGGSFASRTTVMAGNAVYEATQKVREKVLTRGARLLECSRQELVLEDARLTTSDGLHTLTLTELSQQAAARHSAPDEELGLEATHYFHSNQMTYAHGAVVAEVSVDVETGAVKAQHLWLVHDVGTVVNPKTVTGQIEGGAAQGLGGALLEEFVYDESGQLLTASFMDYLLPTIMEMPLVTEKRLERSPSPLNPLGIKGAGECGIAGIGAAIANAVADALGPSGQHVDTLPLTPERVRRWLQADEEKPD